MKKYKLWYGLSGGFGGARDFEIEECENQEEAGKMAWQLACEYYGSYEGLHGLRTIEEIMEEDEIDNEEDAEQTYIEEREDWLDYYVEEYNENED